MWRQTVLKIRPFQSVFLCVSLKSVQVVTKRRRRNNPILKLFRSQGVLPPPDIGDALLQHRRVRRHRRLVVPRVQEQQERPLLQAGNAHGQLHFPPMT